ncbi:MAG: gliding motility-associated C-terminal domain-containing protein [Candidatus Latescibacterota bacterium]|nr:gliding motility-associated C-terminal domain-containing protein [Candidatus Latescibacterota bacterium]
MRFPHRVREGELVELRFASEVFVQATRFDAFLQDSAMGTSVRQRVEPGDATDWVQSSTNAVYLPLDGALFVNVDFDTQCITPNGDGVNETLEVDFDLVNMLEDRPIYLRVFDAAGRRVRSVEHWAVTGPQKLVWDGMDEGGRRVVPGMYIVHLLARGDARDQSAYRTVGVAY